MLPTLNRLKPFLEKVISRKTALPILKSICIRGGFITATDLETTVRMKVRDDRAYTIPLAVLMTVLKTRPLSLLIELEDEKVKLTYDQKQVSFKSLNPDDFPLTPTGRFTSLGVWSPKVLKELHRQIRFTSTDELKPALTGVFIEQNGNLTSCATDGHILRMLKDEQTGQPKNTFKGILPKKSLMILTRLIKNPVRVAASDTPLRLTIKPGLDLYIRLKDEIYPDFKTVIPKTFAGRVTVDKAHITRLLSESKPFLDPKTHAGRFTVTEEGIRFKVVNEDEELTWEASLPVINQSGKNLEVGLNVNLLDTVLQPIDTPEVLWQYGSSTSAGVVTGPQEKEPQAVQLLMPIRMEEE